MAHHIFEILRAALVHYGYWAVAVVLLLENAGIPMPGETVLLLASFLAYSEHDLQIGWIILVATVASTLGDNLGFAVGYYGGRPLLQRYQNIFRIRDKTLARGEGLFRNYGSVTVFFARFVFGMRVIAGPLAGVLRMPWRRFLMFNFLGAALWVTVISGVGYFFGRNWVRLMHDLKLFDLVVAVAVAAGLVFWWWRSTRASPNS
jgi:membrane protein DedA with SNARE-associated domain